MRQYLRSREGEIFFFTLVTHERRSILVNELGRWCLRQAIQNVRKKYPFDLTAIVVLPDHLHAVWQLPKGDLDYSMRWRRIKSRFTRLWLDNGGNEGSRNNSRIHQGERGIWQRRFYEHTCRDEGDLKRCVDYIHVNPLKHGLVERARDWPWSSFHRFVTLGEYELNWGSAANWYGDEFQNAE